MTPDDIAQAMTGAIHAVSKDRQEAFLPSPMIQNHASFLHLLDDGTLLCAWFGGTLEGKSDISIFASVLTAGATRWGPPQRLSHDPAHSEQNPVLFTAPDGVLWLFHTAQPSGNHGFVLVETGDERDESLLAHERTPLEFPMASPAPAG